MPGSFSDFIDNKSAEVLAQQLAGLNIDSRYLTESVIDTIVSGTSQPIFQLVVNSWPIYGFSKVEPNSGITESNSYRIVGRGNISSSDSDSVNNFINNFNDGYYYYLYDTGVYQYYYQQGTGVSWYKVKCEKRKRDGYLSDTQIVYLWIPYGSFGGHTSKISFAPLIGTMPSDTTVPVIDTSNNTITNTTQGQLSPPVIPDIGETDTQIGLIVTPENTTSITEDNSVLDEFVDDFKSLFYEDDKEYFHDLYWFKRQTFSAKSFNSIIGIPVQFMANVDQRYGTSTFGRQFSENILYDAPIAVIQAGSPTLNDSTFYGSTATGLQGVIDGVVATFSWMGAIKQGQTEDVLKTFLVNWLMGGYNRFYSFQSEYNRYIQYVNTLCHVFASYLGIADKTLPGTNTRYANYSDAIEDIELADNGLSMKMRYGNYPGAFIYYQPDSSLSQTFNNMTQESSLASKLNEVSNYTKEMSFLAGTLGFPGKGITVGADVDAGTLFGLGDTTFSFGNNILQRIFNRASEGVGTIIAGCNLALPEIYSGSTMSGTEYTLNIKLVNPYGTPEAAFLFQMRQLARLLALSLPRQYGPNGYTAPFIIRAFSKGQFNVQLGIVESLTIRRAGQGGENQTVHDIPMELDVTMVIKDLYQQFAISNEYGTLEDGLPILRTPKKLKLLFNNVGLLDFIASYAGYNMNQPQIDMQIDYLRDTMYNELTDIVDFNGSMEIKDWKFPRWERMMIDAFMNTVESLSTFLGH